MRKINKTELYNYEVSTCIASEFGMGISRRLMMVCNTTDPIIHFVVMDHDKNIGVYVNIDDAIDTYNKE